MHQSTGRDLDGLTSKQRMLILRAQQRTAAEPDWMLP